MAAFEKLWEVLSTYDNSTVKSISGYLVSRLSKLVKDNIKEFDGKKQIYDFGLNVVAWCLERDLIQQAVTALHTLLNEFLIFKTRLYIDNECFNFRSEFKGKKINYSKKDYNKLRNKFNISKMNYAFYDDWEMAKPNQKYDYNMKYRTNRNRKSYIVILSPDVVALKLVYDAYNPKIEEIVTELKQENFGYEFLDKDNKNINISTLKDLMQNLNNIRNDMNTMVY